MELEDGYHAVMRCTTTKAMREFWPLLEEVDRARGVIGFS